MSIDLLIARMETHPEEFYDKDKLLDSESLAVSIGSSVWGAVVLRITSTDTGVSGGGLGPLYTREEKDRLLQALNIIMRAAVDAEIMRAAMTGERFGAESYHRQMKKNVNLNAAKEQLKQATMAGQNRLAQEMYRNQAGSNPYTGQPGQYNALGNIEIDRHITTMCEAPPKAPKESFWTGLLK
jgi:hypothetical protein